MGQSMIEPIERRSAPESGGAASCVGATTAPHARLSGDARVRAEGKFLYRGQEKLHEFSFIPKDNENIPIIAQGL